jgi:hypothetical protein
MVTEHQIYRYSAKELVIDFGGFEVDKIAAIATGDAFGVFGFLERIFDLDCLGRHGYLIVSANEKMGKYRATNTKATNIPMKIMIKGSTSESSAVMRVDTSSS